MTAEDIHNWDPKKLFHATVDRLEAARHVIPTSMQSRCDRIITDYEKRIAKTVSTTGPLKECEKFITSFLLKK